MIQNETMAYICLEVSKRWGKVKRDQNNRTVSSFSFDNGRVS